MLARTLSLIACTVGLTGLVAAEVTFDQHEVVTGTAGRQTVLTGFLLGGPIAELAVVHLDENDDRRMRIYGFGDGEWVPRLDTTLGPGVSFVDVADIGGRDRLITYQRGSLSWFDPESGANRELVAVTSNFDPPRRGEVPHVDVTRDVNGDGRDDLVVPTASGFRIFVQKQGGTFADPVTIGPAFKADRICPTDGYRYDPWKQSRIHEMDYDRDGRRDLVFWNDGRFEVHRQDARGLFAPAATTFTTEVAFDSDDPTWLAAPEALRHRRKDAPLPGAPTGRVLHSVTDINGDGVADLTVFSLDIRGMFNARSAYEVHFGAPTADGGTVFAKEVGTSIRLGGIPFEIGPRDFDRDGGVDVMFTSIKIGVFKTIGLLAGAVLTRSMSFDVDVYRMEGGAYPDRPNATRKARSVAFGKSGQEATLLPSVLIGDVNGDRRPDLLVQKDTKALHVFLGVPGRELFARRPQQVEVVLPEYEEYIGLADLDRDGKRDMLIHHPSATGPHRVTLLIAR